MEARRGRAASRHRLSSRIVRHHLGLAVLSLAACASILAVLPGTDDKYKVSMATGYVALLFLVATLVIGPIGVLRRRVLPLSDDLRRDIGIWTAALGLLHVIVGIQVHMGSGWLYFFYGPGEAPHRWPLPMRIDAFGASNYAGLLATIILVALLLLSNDVSMRLLGNSRWKRLQQLNYILLALVVVHGVLYQKIEQRDVSWIFLFAALWLCAVILQVCGFRARSARALAQTALTNRATAD